MYVCTYLPLVSLTTLYKDSWISHMASWKRKLQILKKINFFPAKNKFSAITHYTCTYMYIHVCTCTIIIHVLMLIFRAVLHKHFNYMYTCTCIYTYT